MIWTPSTTLLVLLLAGHVLGDFLAQTEGVAERKEHGLGWMLLHGAAMTATHVVVASPFLTARLGLGLVLIGIVHTAIDLARRALVRGEPAREFPGLLLDQAAHALVIVALWWWVTGGDGSAPTADWLVCGAGGAVAAYARFVVVLSGLALNWKGGTAFVRRLLARYPEVVPQETEQAGHGYEMGRTIGCLERTLVFALVLFGQWGALGLVIAAKSIARFKELNDRHFADYYLIGTLASMLVAVGTGILVRYVLGA